MGLSEKEKSRRYRERLRADPEKHAERKRKKRESYHKNKKPISSLPPEEQKNCRIIWKLRKQAQRKRVKAGQNILAITPPSSPSILQEIPRDQNDLTPPPSPAISIKMDTKEKGRKKVRRDRSKLYKENLKLKSEADKWRKKYEKYKKRAHRKEKELLKIKENEIKENIEEDNTKYKTLTNAIKERYKEMKGRSEKNILKNILNKVDVPQKREIVKKALGLHGRIRMSTNTSRNTKLQKKIIDFFQRDDVSRNTAGKKETVSKGKEKVQKRFLLDSMKNLYRSFKLENPDIKCSYFYFTRHRPFYVVRPTVDGRDMCLCKIHTNVVAKIKALKHKKVIESIDLSSLITETVCDSYRKDCMFEICAQCQDRKIKINQDAIKGKIQWFEWVREEEIYLKEGKRIKAVKNIKKLKEDTIQNMVIAFLEELKSVKIHIFNMKTQYKNFRQSIDEIRSNEAVLVVDFSENYNAKCSQEIQAHHFGGSRNQITLHTVVVYIHDTDKKHIALSYCSISPCNIHQPAAIWAHLHPILTNLAENYSGIDTLHFFSDGPFSQYRQKANFFLTCTKTFNYGFRAVSWSFFEAGHGKGPADGIGGYLKREADSKVATGKDIIDAFDFYQILRESSKIKLFYINKDEIEAVQKQIPKNLLPLTGTKEVHQVFTRISSQLMYRNLSCFCSRGFCGCLNPKLYSPIPVPKFNAALLNTCDILPQQDISSDEDLPLSCFRTSIHNDITFAHLHEARNESIYKRIYGASDTSDDENNIIEPQPSTSGQNSELPTIGDFLLVKVYGIKGKTYHTYACIAQSEVEDDGDIKVAFLKCVKGGKLFILNEKDVSYVAYEDVIKKLPKPVVQRKRDVEYFKFSFDINVFEK